MSLTKVSYSMIQGASANVLDYGAKGDGTTDDTVAIQAAVNAVGVAGGGTVYFPTGTYVIVNTPIRVPFNNMNLVGGQDVIIKKQLAGLGSFYRDGFHIGNPLPADGGTNVVLPNTTFNQNITVSGFTFQDCRLGVWVAYCKNVTIEGINALSCTAAVAVGNDATEQCYNITIRNIRQTGWNTNDIPFYFVGIYSTTNFTVDDVIASATYFGFAGSISGIQIENSTLGSLTNIHVDMVDKNYNGITITTSPYVTCSNFSVVNAGTGIQFFSSASLNTYGTFSNGTITSSTVGVRCWTQNNIISNVTTKNCTTDIALMTDAQKNVFSDNTFNPGGDIVVYEEAGSTYASGLDLQVWFNNTGFLNGFANGYFGTQMAHFGVTTSVGASNVTGNGTAYTLTWNVANYNGLNYAASFVMNLATGIFTAPITGTYTFNAGIEVTGYAGSLYTSVELFIKTGSDLHLIGKSYELGDTFVSGAKSFSLARLTQVSLVIKASGGTLNADISASILKNYFTGMLIS